MTVSLVEATAAARRIQAGLDVRAPGRAEWEQRANDYEDEGDVHQFQYAEGVVAGLMLASGLEDDFRLLAGFVLAGDTERLRTAWDGYVMANEVGEPWQIAGARAALDDAVRAALGGEG